MRFIAPQWRPSTGKRRSQFRSAMDVTGFAAVMLALLFLMMFGLIYPMHPRPLPVDMAVARHSSALPSALRDDAITVGITRDGSLYINFSRISPADLPGVLRDAMSGHQDKTVYVRADARAKYGDVKVALDAIRIANLTDIAFLTERPLPVSTP